MINCSIPKIEKYTDIINNIWMTLASIVVFYRQCSSPPYHLTYETNILNQVIYVCHVNVSIFNLCLATNKNLKIGVNLQEPTVLYKKDSFIYDNI
jgi:hypothetical protein